MKKLSVIVSLSLMLSSLSWAEKYEFVRLKVTQANAVLDSTNNIYHGESVTLNSGDVAKIIAVPNRHGYITVWDGEDYLYYDPTINGSPHPNVFIGPCEVIIYSSSISNYSVSLSLAIERASDTGSTTLAWNGTEWEGSSDGSQQANNNSSPVPDPSGIKYDSLLGWAYFTDTPWVYSYTNGSWYYMHSLPDGIYVWNANLPNNGWMKLHG